MIYQTDSRLNDKINKYGCRFMCLLAIPQIELKKDLAIEQVRDIYNRFSKNPNILNENCRAGSEEHIIINYAFQLLGKDNVFCRQIGKIDDKGMFKIYGKEEESSKDYKYVIAHWETDGENGHFTLFDDQNKEIYDPYDKVYSKKKILKRLCYKIWEKQ